jgi:hypothetical protein
MRTSSVRSTPVRPSPFPAGPCGSSLASVACRFYAASSPLCGLLLSSKSASVLQPHPPAHGECTSPGISPPTAHLGNGRPYSPEVPPSGTVRPQGLVTLTTSCFARILAGVFQPAALLGLSPDLGGSPGSFDPDRADAPGFPPRDFLLPRDEHVFACSPLLRFAADDPLLRFTTRDGRCRVSIAEESAFSVGATRGRQPPRGS